MKKTLLSIAIIAALPMGAWADYTYRDVYSPVSVADNGTIIRSVYNPPYVTVTIDDDDDEHIASTAYVKGAYNDTIAAINYVGMEVNSGLEYVTEMLIGKRVDVYTTWEDDEATTQVALSDEE